MPPMTDCRPLRTESKHGDDQSTHRGWSDPAHGEWFWSESDSDELTGNADASRPTNPQQTTEPNQPNPIVTSADHNGNSMIHSGTVSGEQNPTVEPTDPKTIRSDLTERTDADSPRPLPHVPYNHTHHTRNADTGDTNQRDENQDHPSRVAAGPERDSISTTDDMTMALTLAAVRQLANPGAAVCDATDWADWIGLVGNVSVEQLDRHCDEFSIDPDFINATGTDPAERLSGIERGSMFHAQRLVVVGTRDEQSLATDVGWEFVSITEAASKAGWDLENS